jgi:hypothetical protein
MSLLVLYQQTHAEVICSRSARVISGPVLNGELSRMHSVLYRPMAVSARALSYASPTVPMEGCSPAPSGWRGPAPPGTVRAELLMLPWLALLWRASF